MYAMYPKGKSSLPKPGNGGRKAKSEQFGSVHTSRPNLGMSDESVHRRLSNDYGKTPQVSEDDNYKVRVSPRRTMIHGI